MPGRRKNGGNVVHQAKRLFLKSLSPFTFHEKGFFEQHGGEGLVLQRIGIQAARQMYQLSTQSPVRLQGGYGLHQGLFETLVQGGTQQGGLVGEVQKNRPDGHIGSSGNVADGGLGKPVGGKRMSGGLQNALAGDVCSYRREGFADKGRSFAERIH